MNFFKKIIYVYWVQFNIVWKFFEKYISILSKKYFNFKIILKLLYFLTHVNMLHDHSTLTKTSKLILLFTTQ